MELTKRAALDSDIDFARSVHHLAYRDVVTRQFGAWDEAMQDGFFEKGWGEAPFQILMCDSTPCGYASVEENDEHIFVRELVILPEFQGRGIGTQFLEQVFEDARVRQLPVQLQALHENYALNLYRRLGFQEYGKTSIHILMRWNGS